MRLPLQITFHGVDHSDAMETNIRAAVARLERIDERITGCRVAVEGRNRASAAPKVALRIRIDLTVPGSELVVTEEPAEHQRQDPKGAIRRAFAHMERRLREHRGRARS